MNKEELLKLCMIAHSRHADRLVSDKNYKEGFTDLEDFLYSRITIIDEPTKTWAEKPQAYTTPPTTPTYPKPTTPALNHTMNTPLTQTTETAKKQILKLFQKNKNFLMLETIGNKINHPPNLTTQAIQELTQHNHLRIKINQSNNPTYGPPLNRPPSNWTIYKSARLKQMAGKGLTTKQMCQVAALEWNNKTPNTPQPTPIGPLIKPETPLGDNIISLLNYRPNKYYSPTLIANLMRFHSPTVKAALITLLNEGKIHKHPTEEKYGIKPYKQKDIDVYKKTRMKELMQNGMDFYSANRIATNEYKTTKNSITNSIQNSIGNIQ